jgi:hypothetical protein
MHFVRLESFEKIPPVMTQVPRDYPQFIIIIIVIIFLD